QGVEAGELAQRDQGGAVGGMFIGAGADTGQAHPGAIGHRGHANMLCPTRNISIPGATIMVRSRRAGGTGGSMTDERAAPAFEPDAESMPQEQLAGLQQDRLRSLINRLLAADGVQAGRLKDAGVSGGADV